eukprot:COSAG05_NODE_4597_length_1445_cov_1173.902675_1_plen_21_part_10
MIVKTYSDTHRHTHRFFPLLP